MPARARLAPAAFALGLAAGCTDKTERWDTGPASGDGPYPVPDGTFTLDSVSAEGFTEADFAGLTLTVDRAAMQATLTPTSGDAVVLALGEVPEADWIKDCYTNNSYSLSELLTVSPDPVAIGALGIPGPGLTTMCGGRLLLGTVAGGAVRSPTLGFSD